MVVVVMAAAIYLCYGAVFEGGWRFGGLRWIDTGSEFGLCYWCWIFFWLFFGGFCIFYRPINLEGGGIWVSA